MDYGCMDHETHAYAAKRQGFAGYQTLMGNDEDEDEWVDGIYPEGFFNDEPTCISKGEWRVPLTEHNRGLLYPKIGDLYFNSCQGDYTIIMDSEEYTDKQCCFYSGTPMRIIDEWWKNQENPMTYLNLIDHTDPRSLAPTHHDRIILRPIDGVLHPFPQFSRIGE